MNHSCTLLYKFEVLGAHAGYESTFSSNLISMIMLVKCDHAIKRSLYCKNSYLKLRLPLTSDHNDIAIVCFFFTYQFDMAILIPVQWQSKSMCVLLVFSQW